ncbi:CDP-6-deoxy-delta-3,4-glucoseen reductase [Luteimonas padinae]|nr:CDP-6-deoxy-delta-3,4-glucoseen reductase [Luteimonas padinae]
MSAVPAPAMPVPAAPPDLDAMLSARTVWRAARAPAVADDGEPTGHDALDALLPQGGWPRAALTELLLPADGVGELSLLLPMLARLTRAGGIVALVAPPYLPYAPAWQAAGVDLRQLEIIQADARGALWAFEQCLRSAACAAVLGWPLQADAPALRRLQVAADSGDCLGFAFRDAKHAANPSPAALRLEYAAVGEGGWHVRKCRGANPPGRPFKLPAGTTAGAAVGAATAATRCRKDVVAAIAAPTAASATAG